MLMNSRGGFPILWLKKRKTACGAAVSLGVVLLVAYAWCSEIVALLYTTKPDPATSILLT